MKNTSLVGALVVVCGLYVVLWGKAKDFDSTSKPEEDSAESRDAESGYYKTNMKEPFLTESLHDADNQRMH